MRFECTIMRVIENSSSSTESSEEGAESTSEEMLEMRRPPRKIAAPLADGTTGTFGKGGVRSGGDVIGGDHHTEEYWKSARSNGGKSKDDWVKEQEGLNRGHRASESFAVLNELVVVCPPLPTPLVISLRPPFSGFVCVLTGVGPRPESIFEYVGVIW
jgi:hypothetical protein